MFSLSPCRFIASSLSLPQQALKENLRQRELEEKQRRARVAKEKAEREKQERQQKKRRLLEVNAGRDCSFALPVDSKIA